MNKLNELKKKIENIKITYDYEETYNNLYNTIIDYENETQDWDFEYLFEDFIDYEIAEGRAKWELENGGLERLKYYINDTRFYNEEIFRIDAYGNLHNIYKDDLEYLKSEIIDIIDGKMEK